MNQLNPILRQRISTLRWMLPVALAIFSVFYQLGPARWLHDHYSNSLHYAAEIFFYALAGPAAVYLAIGQIRRWLDDTNRFEQQARASERRLASIMAASADAILSLDPDGYIESWNHGAELLFGYAATEVQGQPLADLFPDSQAARVELDWLLEMVRRAGFMRGHETTCLDADGRRIAVELTATQLSDEGGEPLGISIILRDITKRKQREAEIHRLNISLNEQVAERTRDLDVKVAQLARANADLQKVDETRSEFVSLVSHQIRAPLTNMGGAVQRMQTDCDAINPTCNRMFTILAQQVARLNRLVQDVLNASRLETGEMSLQPEPISVQPMVQQAIEQIRARTTTRSIRLPDKPGLPLVYADRDRVSEVLANLLDNADKYSPPGQTIAIQVRADQAEVTISVRDSGPGLPPGDFERVFDKFYRTDSSDSQIAYGYGLGLYVCRQLLEAQGGRIWAENHPDGGAVFSFALPVWQG